MNYESKIEELRLKGILNNDQAERMKSSINSNHSMDKPVEPEKVKKRSYLNIPGIALALLAVGLIIFTMQIPSETPVIQDVAANLNSTEATGQLSASYSLLWIILAAFLGLYLLLYFLAIQGFNTLKTLHEKIEEATVSVHQSGLLQHELSPLIENRLKEYLQHEKEALQQDVSSMDKIVALYSESPKLRSDTLVAFAIETDRELKEGLMVNKEYLASLIREYNVKLHTFPHLLAGLLGDFPAYQYDNQEINNK